MKPYCFMIMPFGKKSAALGHDGATVTIDFDVLWNNAFFPMLESLGFRPIRADQESNALIINQMIQRIYFSDVVLVDVTIPNGNVMYELGIRHAVREKGCILVAASGSKKLFDIAQMRTATYPLQQPVGEVAAAAIRAAIAPHVPSLRTGLSPVFELLPGYPANVRPDLAKGIGDQFDDLATFQGKIRGIQLLPEALRAVATREAIKEYFPSALPTVSIALLQLLASSAGTLGWASVVEFIDQFDEDVRKEVYVREQRALALGKLGRPAEAIVELTTLMELNGETEERHGLIGGRYKELMRAAQADGNGNAASTYRDKAIEHYARGMMLNLNEFYCASNLPRLYRSRRAPGDEQNAVAALHVTHLSCEAMRNKGPENPWIHQTLVGAAFDCADIDRATELAEIIRRSGVTTWYLRTTLADLGESAGQIAEPALRQKFERILDDLKQISL